MTAAAACDRRRRRIEVSTWPQVQKCAVCKAFALRDRVRSRARIRYLPPLDPSLVNQRQLAGLTRASSPCPGRTDSASGGCDGSESRTEPSRSGPSTHLKARVRLRLGTEVALSVPCQGPAQPSEDGVREWDSPGEESTVHRDMIDGGGLKGMDRGLSRTMRDRRQSLRDDQLGPVCQAINQGTLIPGTNVFSAFSFDCIPTNGIGQTGCTQAPYAGCMTAPCFKTSNPQIVQCSCPVFNGPYQVGQNDQACTLGDDLVWSAAYAPPKPQCADISSSVRRYAEAPAAVPSPGTCLPDAPGAIGCPLYVPGTTMLPPDSGVDCARVCNEYRTCQGTGGVQTGYTCDATLCTDECNDRDLVGTACSGLSKCDVSEIIKAETAAECSCCASQLCGCNPNVKTNTAIAALNQQQRDRGIAPQCDVNGTLCGSP